MAQYAIIGLGSFGITLALQLAKMGNEVIGIDNDRKVVESVASSLSHAVIADATDEVALEELSLAYYDAVVVAIGEDMKASLICVVHLKNLGLQNIWVKATTDEHHLILKSLGVSRIIHPEEEMGVRTARTLYYPMIREYMSLGDRQYVVEIPAIEKLSGTVLSDLLSEVTGHVFCLLIKRREKLYPSPHEQFVIEQGDMLVLAGDRLSLTKLVPRLV
ncbi:TrkA family potassium uptake protein [Methylomarinum sp. Ch1-1]|uniref:TrkA family potassium uptake protein n=1 Tax=Methylomarinum roseum TaxID=3067653 RepID=A0AAU7NR34_9GAMM|nr:TrkA family potassium uptake protein [Methylomarinum sp. Ch1-1]MDP4520621.1 TrkA family potassium uptake protein [Methylomarinum sp. Ch1-1]